VKKTAARGFSPVLLVDLSSVLGLLSATCDANVLRFFLWVEFHFFVPLFFFVTIAVSNETGKVFLLFYPLLDGVSTAVGCPSIKICLSVLPCPNCCFSSSFFLLPKAFALFASLCLAPLLLCAIGGSRVDFSFCLPLISGTSFSGFFFFFLRHL